MTPAIEINKVHFPVTSLGFGQRVGIWFQGCSIRCPGCISVDTWQPSNQNRIDQDSLIDGIRPLLSEADGITLSGGEPFDQPQALARLIQKIRHLTDPSKFDVLVFSGYPVKTLQSKHAKILDQLDALIAEPYLKDQGQTLNLRGSDNQQFIIFSELGKVRYGDDANNQLWPTDRSLDIVVDEDTIWMAGIPQPKMLRELEQTLEEQGYFVSKNSQNATSSVRA